MNNYFDKYGMLHDKPCINGEPSSNNPFIYTAYYVALGGKVDPIKLREYFKLCYRSDKPLEIWRRPDKPTPPLSHDEALGMVYLGLISVGEFKRNHWNYVGKGKPLHRINWLEAMEQLFKLVGAHRNKVWKKYKKKDAAFQLAFKFQPQYQAVLEWHRKKSPSKFCKYIHKCYVKDIRKTRNASHRNVAWLCWKLSGKGRVDYMFKEYFPSDHPIMELTK